MLRLLALLVLAGCAHSEVDGFLEDVVKTPAERCQEAKAIIATFPDPTTQERALVVAACVS
jgi:metal-dependent hydrolase (beta-lactamase superfamily II)